MIRFMIGMLCIFGAVGALETTNNLPLVWLFIGIICVFSSLKTGVR